MLADALRLEFGVDLRTHASVIEIVVDVAVELFASVFHDEYASSVPAMPPRIDLRAQFAKQGVVLRRRRMRDANEKGTLGMRVIAPPPASRMGAFIVTSIGAYSSGSCVCSPAGREYATATCGVAQGA
jgi:hypothetical protein